MHQPSLHSPSYEGHVVARRASLRALLNSYFRETGVFDPRAGTLSLDPSLLDAGEPMAVAVADGQLIGSLTRFSLGGQHRYGDAFYWRDGQARLRPLDLQDLVQCLLEALSPREPGSPPSLKLWDLRDKITNSYARMAAHLDAFHRRYPDGPPPGLDHVRAEQSLLVGHPFHPFPKCCDGRGRQDISVYSPERESAFALHYFAVHRDLVHEDWLDAGRRAEAEAAVPEAFVAALDKALEHARADTIGRDQGGLPAHGGGIEAFRALPVHPWQAQHLHEQGDVIALIQRGLLIDLGTLGAHAYPTSSVRSVWLPQSRMGYKLPLQVRITNLVRENTLEQCRRTLAAARVIDALGDRLQRDGLKVVLETGYRTLALDHPGVPAHRIATLTTIYRPLPDDGADPWVMASLLEPYPGRDEPKLVGMIREGCGGELPALEAWFDRYLEISVVPLLAGLARTGVGFEAHLQNTLLTLKEGFPETFHVRDLEGVSLDRSAAGDTPWWSALGIDDDSPLLYSPDDAWTRTLYYVFVNQLGGLVAVLSEAMGVEEGRLWRRVGARLEGLTLSDDPRLAGYAERLLHDSNWTAKANLLSCFHQRGDAPLFVAIPNPIKASR
ncbi:IucA/IucC family protein [Halomonas sp. V046]|uniref:IucA/IucC family protein n=1 Tax=Halomonas sp. V046 TaxID=3459611 RepID=UPI004044A34F